MEVDDKFDSHDHESYKQFGKLLLTQVFDETASKSDTLDRNIRSAQRIGVLAVSSNTPFVHSAASDATLGRNDATCYLRVRS